MKKILITGVSGFVGNYLAREILEVPGNDILGTVNTSENSDLIGRIRQEKIDLKDTASVKSLISEFKPDVVFHLAALTSAKDSFDNPGTTLTDNILMEINVLEALRKNDLLDTKTIIISSSEIYGLVNAANIPINEETPLNPTNPYAVSKIAQDYLALQYFISYKMKIIRMRPFNHFGPGQSPNFVIPAFAKQIAEIEKGKLDEIKVGNLQSKKDFTDVKDIVKGYVLASEKGKDGESYNIGSGKSYKISEILDMLISLSKAKVKVVQDPSRLRPSDNPELVCDYSKFNKATGWAPQIPLEQTLKETLDYWRRII